jgi:hypothetical protein
MRIVAAAALFAAVSGFPALAQEAPVDFDTLAIITATATKGYAHPETAIVAQVRKSLARNGTGYCGSVTVEDSDEVTVFHVILESPDGPSVIRLSEYPDAEESNNAAMVHQLMHNFGCVE